jgi:small subunit ribosomal protein S6
MRNYEAMFIVNPDLNEDARKDLLTKIKDIITKNNGKVLSADLWSEKRRLYFPLKRYKEGIYYLLSFNSDPNNISTINHDYKLNENILRVLITNIE